MTDADFPPLSSLSWKRLGPPGRGRSGGPARDHSRGRRCRASRSLPVSGAQVLRPLIAGQTISLATASRQERSRPRTWKRDRPRATSGVSRRSLKVTCSSAEGRLDHRCVEDVVERQDRRIAQGRDQFRDPPPGNSGH
ncbi:MAG TPA: hypothetical protein VKP69_02770, partial [Isosphaeraceae bacterium]|nr:hypothetical protein [Isosphaeraceae bacterium]